MNLFQAAALGATDKGATSVANKIRREAEEAFKERLQQDQFKFEASQTAARIQANEIEGDKNREQEQQLAQDRMIHDANQTAAQIGARENEGLLARKHQTDEREAGQKHQADEKRKDRLHELDLQDKELERAVKVAEAKAKGSSSEDVLKERRLAYQNLLDNKYRLHDALNESDPEAAKKVWREIQKLEGNLKQELGMKQPVTKESLVAQVLKDNGLQDTPENRQLVETKMQGDPSFATYFESGAQGAEAPSTAGLMQPKPKSGEADTLKQNQKAYADKIERDTAKRENRIPSARYNLKQMLAKRERGEPLTEDEIIRAEDYIAVMQASHNLTQEDKALLEALSNHTYY